MPRERGLRERKRAQTRERLADVAAALFAERGYDAVSVVDVARAADVSDQTVYNYFPAKQDLVLDRAEQIRERYRSVVAERPAGTSPADALRPLVEQDIDRYAGSDPRRARGEFPALCLQSPLLRRFALEARDRQADTVSAAITGTDPGVHPVLARAHAAALISVVQTITDQIGARVLDGAPPHDAAAAMRSAARVGLDHLDSCFATATDSTVTDSTTPTRK